jgi:hypothetical protein
MSDVLDTPGGPVHSEPPPNPRRKITCEFCECELGQSGEYKSLSDTAKKYRALKDTNEKLEAELTKVRQDCESLRHEIEALSQRQKSGPRAGSRFRKGESIMHHLHTPQGITMVAAGIVLALLLAPFIARFKGTVATGL